MDYTKDGWKFNRKYAPQTHGIKVSDDLFSSVTSGDTVVCFLPEPHYMPDMGDRAWFNESVKIMKANANLIAAAPKLHNQLSLAIRTINDTLRHGLTKGQIEALSQCIVEAHKVMLKAEGR